MLSAIQNRLLAQWLGPVSLSDLAVLIWPGRFMDDYGEPMTAVRLVGGVNESQRVSHEKWTVPRLDVAIALSAIQLEGIHHDTERRGASDPGVS